MGGVFATIKASSDDAYRRLISKIIEFYAQALFNPHWGEQLVFAPGGVLSISMVLARPRPATGRSDVASLLRLGLGVRAGFQHCFGAEDHQRAGAPFLGPRLAQDGSRLGHLGRPSRRAGGQHLLGRQPRGGGRGLVRLSSPPGCLTRCSQTISASAWPTRCSRRRSIAASRFISTRARGRDRGGDRCGQGYGDEPGGRRCVRARDQRRLRTARLSRRSRP